LRIAEGDVALDRGNGDRERLPIQVADSDCDAEDDCDAPAQRTDDALQSRVGASG
jgi:hypothetical protein